MKKVGKWASISLVLTLILILTHILFYLTKTPALIMAITNGTLALGILISLLVTYILQLNLNKTLSGNLKKISLSVENEKKIDTTLLEIQDDLKPLVNSLNMIIEKLRLVESELGTLENIAEIYRNIVEELYKFNLEVEIPDQPGFESLKELKNSLISSLEVLLEATSKLLTEISKNRKINKKLKRAIISIRKTEEEIRNQIQNLSLLGETIKANTKIKEEIVESEKTLTTTLNLSNSSKQKISTITNHLEEAINSSNSLLKEVKEISEISNSIKEISEQTLLLSMNALIESSKAGEYGKGFAVIAEEIRKLSTSIGNLSEVISSKAEVMKGNINKILLPTKDSQENLKNLLSELETSIKNLEKLEETNRKLLEIANTSSPNLKMLDETKEALTQSTKLLEIITQELTITQKETNKLIENKLAIISDQNEKAFKKFKIKTPSKQLIKEKILHLKFMEKVENYFENKELLSAENLEEIGNYATCPLEKWYLSFKENYPNISSFSKFEKVHKELHEIAKVTLELVIKNSEDKALEYLEKLEKLSIELTEILDEILKELLTHENTE